MTVESLQKAEGLFAKRTSVEKHWIDLGEVCPDFRPAFTYAEKACYLCEHYDISQKEHRCEFCKYELKRKRLETVLYRGQKKIGDY